MRQEMDKVWLKSYPEGVPAEIDSTQYRSITQLFEEAFRKFADRNAYVCMDKFLTFGELDRMSQKMGAWLQSKGLKPGARIAIMLPNVLQYPVAMVAALRAGYIVVNVNPLYTPRELQHQLIDSGAEAIIVLENFATTVEQVIASTEVKHVIVASMGDMLGGLKGMIVNLVVRKVKKLVPAFSLPGSITFKKMLSDAEHLKLQRSSRATTTSPSCNTRAAPPASPRAPCCCTATSSPTCCKTRPGCRCRRRASKSSSSARCRCTTSIR